MIDQHPGRGAAWLARLTGGQEVGGSNPLAPNSYLTRGYGDFDRLVGAEKQAPASLQRQFWAT